MLISISRLNCKILPLIATIYDITMENGREGFYHVSFMIRLQLNFHLPSLKRIQTAFLRDNEIIRRQRAAESSLESKQNFPSEPRKNLH